MSDGKVHSKPILEGPQCSFEDLVCIDKPEYHENPVAQECSEEIVVVVEYKMTKKGIREIVKVDEQKALANRAQTFHEEPKPKKAEKSKNEDGDADAPSPPQPHFHGEANLASEAVAVSNPHAEAPQLNPTPFLAFSAALCFYCFDRSDSITEQETGNRVFSPEAVCETSEPLFTADPSAILAGSLWTALSEGVPENKAIPLPVFFLFEQPEDLSIPTLAFSQTVLPSQKEGHPEPAPVPSSVKEGGDLFPFVHRHSLVQYAAEPGIPWDSPREAVDLSTQGAVAVFPSHPPFFETVSLVVVLPPSLVSPKEVFIPRLSALRLGESETYQRINRGSDSQGSKDPKQQKGQGQPGSHRYPA